jgi:lipopolysaccharide assembly outer membrane protein LptD (OstA)
LFIVFIFIVISFAAGISEKTLITGDEMEVRKAGEIAILKGNSKVVAGGNVMTASKMIYDKKNSFLSAFDNVTLLSKMQNGERLEVCGNFAHYYINDKKGEFWGDNTVAKYFARDSSSTLPIILRAQKIYIDRNLETLNAYDDVIIETSSGTVYSDNAIFNGKTLSAVFQKHIKRPIAHVSYGDRKEFYEADEMILNIAEDNKKIIMNGGVAGKIEMEDKTNDTQNQRFIQKV